MELLFNLLDPASSSGGAGKPGNSWTSMLIWLIPIALIVVFMVISSRQRKKQQAEAEEKMNALKVGDKVLTIGSIYGEIVEIDQDNGTFVIKTGSEENFSYLKIDRSALARIIPENPPVEETAENEDEKAKQLEEGTEVPEENKDIPEEANLETAENPENVEEKNPETEEEENKTDSEKADK